MSVEVTLESLAEAIREAKSAQGAYEARCRRTARTASEPNIPLDRRWHLQAADAQREAAGGTLASALDKQILVIRKQTVKIEAERLNIEFERYGELIRLYERRFRDKERDLIEFFDARTPDELRAERASLSIEANRTIRSEISSENDYRKVMVKIDEYSKTNEKQFRDLKGIILNWNKYKGDKIREIGAGWGLIVAVTALVFTAIGQFDRVIANVTVGYDLLSELRESAWRVEDHPSAGSEPPPIN